MAQPHHQRNPFGASPLFNKELPQAVQDIFKTRLFRRLDLIEAHLAKHTYLAGDGFTVADAYLFTVLGWMKVFSISLGGWPQIAAYAERIAARPSVAAALERETAIPAVE